MNISLKKHRISLLFRLLVSVMILTFASSGIMPLPKVQAQSVLNLPQPGEMVAVSPVFAPPVLKGLIINPEQPFQFDFVFDSGDSKLTKDEIKEESSKLIKYFLTSLTIPENELWVNLSPSGWVG